MAHAAAGVPAWTGAEAALTLVLPLEAVLSRLATPGRGPRRGPSSAGTGAAYEAEDLPRKTMFLINIQ